MTETQLIFYPPSRGRGAALEAGFRFGHVGTHASRTIMLDELSATFEAVPPEAKPAEYAAAIIDANCLGKRTVATRRISVQRLRELYAIDPGRAYFPNPAPAMGDRCAGKTTSRPSRQPCSGPSSDGNRGNRGRTIRRCGVPESSHAGCGRESRRRAHERIDH